MKGAFYGTLRRRFMRQSAAMCFIAVFCFTAFAQEQLINISGTVTSPGNKPIPGAIVTLQGQKLADTTDATGAYSITADNIGVHRNPILPGAERISLANGKVSIGLTKQSPVMIEMFDIKGHLQQRVLERNASAGEYRFELSRSTLAAQLMVIRVSVGNRNATFRYLPLSKSRCAIASATHVSSTTTGLTKAQAAVDSLKIEAAGYTSKGVPATSYQGTVNITLDSADAEQTFGTFVVTLNHYDTSASLLGAINDGVTPSAPIWETVMRVGSCRLLKPRNPFCEEGCPGGLCVEDDSCQMSPTPIDVGKVTSNGLKTTDGATTFTMKMIGTSYQPSVTLDFPPFSEGDPVTMAAEGKGSVAAFTLSAKGISLLKILNDTIKLLDSQAIDLRWEPPAIAGNTRIYVLIDITYHGGTKAKIECDCEDDGELIIPAAMLDKLKTFGISGWPRIDIVRRQVGPVDPTVKAKLILEYTRTIGLVIPGIISCNNDGQCPEGQTCQPDRKCK